MQSKSQQSLHMYCIILFYGFHECTTVSLLHTFGWVSYWRELGWANEQCADQRQQDYWFSLPSSVYVENNHSLPSNILSIKQSGSSPVPQQTAFCSNTGAWTESAQSPIPPHPPHPRTPSIHGDSSWCAIQNVTTGIQQRCTNDTKI